MNKNLLTHLMGVKDNFIKTGKKILFSLFLIVYSHLNAQITLTLRPDASTGKDVFLSSQDPATNFGNHPELSATGWTCSGNPCASRGLIQFDLTSIPINATILSAELSLYANPTPVNGNGIAMQGSANASLLQRVTSTWDENTITWSTQPTTTAVNQVSLPQSSSSFQNYPDIDVKNLIQDMIDSPSASFGFMLKLQSESYYNSMIFASSDYADSSVHPQLVITYTTDSSTCIDVSTDKDAFLVSGDPTGNYGNHPDFGALGWTCSGSPCYARCPIQIDLSGIPVNSTIVAAKLSFYANPTPANGGGIAMQGTANTSLLQRITSAWNENTVTWSTQPTTTTVNQVILPQSSSSFQNYLDIDFTGMVQDMVNNPSSSFGLMLKLQSENYYNSMTFASSDYADTSLHPKFEVCYLANTGIEKFSEPANFNLGVFPNPFSEYFNVSYTLNKKSNVSIEIFDVMGKSVYKTGNNIQAAGKHQLSFKPAFYSSGIYLVKLGVNENYITQKVIYQKY